MISIDTNTTKLHCSACTKAKRWTKTFTIGEHQKLSFRLCLDCRRGVAGHFTELATKQIPTTVENKIPYQRPVVRPESSDNKVSRGFVTRKELVSVKELQFKKVCMLCLFPFSEEGVEGLCDKCNDNPGHIIRLKARMKTRRIRLTELKGQDMRASCERCHREVPLVARLPRCRRCPHCNNEFRSEVQGWAP